MKDTETKPKNIHWIVLADASRAQVFETDPTLEVLTPIDSHAHADEAPAVAVVEVEAGSGREHAGGPHKSFEHKADSQTADVFAREVATAIEAGRVAHRFAHLVLIAPPSFLGALRGHLSADATRCVVGSVAHEWTAVPLHELAGRIRTALPELNPASAA